MPGFFLLQPSLWLKIAPVPAAQLGVRPPCPGMAELRKSGVEFHALSDDQLAEWKEAGGYQRSEWDGLKADLAGSMDTFAKFDEAAGTMGRYYVHDA